MAIKWKQFIYNQNKIRLISEFIVLYLVLPLLVMFRFLPIPLLLILLVMGVSVHLFLQYDPSFNRNNFYNWESGKKEIWKILVLFIPLAALMVVLIYHINKTKLFYLPASNPLFLLMISIFYPEYGYLPVDWDIFSRV